MKSRTWKISRRISSNLESLEWVLRAWEGLSGSPGPLPLTQHPEPGPRSCTSGTSPGVGREQQDRAQEAQGAEGPHREAGDTLGPLKVSVHGRTEEEGGVQQFRERQSCFGVEIAKPISAGPSRPEPLNDRYVVLRKPWMLQTRSLPLCFWWDSSLICVWWHPQHSPPQRVIPKKPFQTLSWGWAFPKKAATSHGQALSLLSASAR